MAPANDEDLLFSKSNNNTNEVNEILSDTALIQKYQEAANIGLKSMNIDQFLDSNIDVNDDTISLTGGANDERMSQFSQFTHIPSKHNKLPCVIGTSNFYNDPYLGIIELDDQIIAKSQVQGLVQSTQSGFAPTQIIFPESQMQQSIMVDEQQQQQQIITNPAAPQAPSLDLLLQGAATKKTDPPQPQVNLLPPPINNASIKFDYNQIEESVMYKQGFMVESVAVKDPIQVEGQSDQKKARKPMFEDFSSSSDEEDKQGQDQQQQEQQQQQEIEAAPDAFMMKLRKMQENKAQAQQEQTLQLPPQQKSQLPVLESKIESPTLIQNPVNKTNNLFDDNDDDEAMQPPISKQSQPIIEAKQQNKGLDMFGDDNNDDETFEGFLKREKQQEIKKLGTLLVDDDEEENNQDTDMFGTKKSNIVQPKQASALPALPVFTDKPNKEKKKTMFDDEEDISQQQPPSLIDQSGTTLPSFQFDNPAPKRSLLPKAKTSNNAFGDIPSPPNRQQSSQQKKFPNLFDDEEEEDGLFYKKK